MDNPGRSHRHRWLRHVLRGACVCFALAAGTTWLGAIYDFPVDAAVVKGMNAPECAQVRALQAGSILSAPLPDSDVCRSFFMYRTSFLNAADDAATYRTWVLRQRVGEFRQLIGYVLVLYFLALSGIAAAAAVVVGTVRRLRRSPAVRVRAEPRAPGSRRRRYP